MPIGNEMAVFDESDQPLPNGELGEIVLRGPNIFKNYFKNRDGTEKAFAGGWFHTGDIGYRDSDGFYYIADRKSDMIIRGGENIYPREIDDILYTHPAVEHAAVIGIPDELTVKGCRFYRTQDAPKRPSRTLSSSASSTWRISKPTTVHFVDDIPKGPTGKLLKRDLANCFK